MNNKMLRLALAIICLAIPFAYAAYLYPSLPETIPTHFNLKGEADGFGGKDSIYLGPIIMAFAGLFTYFLLTNIKKIDPKRSVQVEDRLFQNMALVTVIFLSALSLVILYMTIHPGVGIDKLLFPVMGLAFSVMGYFMPQLKQNYFAGFKLPWTLENEANWIATHKVAGKVWLYGGMVQILAGLLLDSMPSCILFFASMIVMVLIPTIFSYRMFKNGNQA